MSTNRITAIAMLATIALIIYVLEAQLPPLVAIPGIKPGLANIITLVAILLLNKRDALLILILRIILGSIFAGQMMSFFYSLVGGLFCFAVMSLLSGWLGERQNWVLSVFGAIAHNMGQLLVAVVILGTLQIVWYAPILLIGAIIVGTFTGLCAQYLIPHLRRLQSREGWF